jgi:hypothetical protein
VGGWEVSVARDVVLLRWCLADQIQFACAGSVLHLRAQCHIGVWCLATGLATAKDMQIGSTQPETGYPVWVLCWLTAGCLIPGAANAAAGGLLGPGTPDDVRMAHMGLSFG